MTARGPRPGAGDAGGSSTRTCHDCVPPLVVQAGAWGWRAHLYALHGEGGDPGPHPSPAQPPKREGKPWTEAERAEFHRRNQAARRKQRSTPPATPRPPRSTG